MFLEISKECLARVFSCEFCKISKNTFLESTSGRLFLNRNNHFFRPYRGVFRTLSCILDGTFGKNSDWFSAVNYFSKKLHLRCLTRFWIRLWEPYRKYSEWSSTKTPWHFRDAAKFGEKNFDLAFHVLKTLTRF